MTKKWEKSGERSYTFSINEREIGTLELFPSTLESKATATIGENAFTIKRTGFWKSSIEISDAQGEIVAQVYHEKWYSNAFILEYGGKAYKLLIRNNPLAEWAILEDEAVLLAYGLDTANGKAALKITAGTVASDPLLDFLLWYLFLPVAAENCGDDFVFLLLLTAQ